MKNLLGVLIFLFGVLCGCSESENSGDLYTIKIDHDNIYKGAEYDITHIFTDDIEIIPLEVHDNVLLSDDCDYKVYDSEFLISSGTSNGELYRFKSDGTFLNTISKTGRGPGELISVIHWERIEDSVLFFNNLNSKYLIYGLDGLGYREFPKTEGLYEQKLWYNDGKLNIQTWKGESKLISYDIKSGDVVNVMKHDTTLSNYAWSDMGNYPSVYNDNLYFGYWGSDTVYVYNGQEVKPAFCFDLVNGAPLDVMKRGVQEFFQYVQDVNVTWNPSLFALTDNYLFIEYSYGVGAFFAIHSLDSGETSACYAYISDGLPIYDFRIKDNNLYFMVGVSELMELIPDILETETVSFKVKDKLKNLLSSLSEDDNPVIFVKQFK